MNGDTTPAMLIEFIEQMFQVTKIQSEAMSKMGSILDASPDTKKVFDIMNDENTHKTCAQTIKTMRTMYELYVRSIQLLTSLTEWCVFKPEIADIIEGAVVDAIAIGVPLTYVRRGSIISMSLIDIANNDTSEDLEG